MLANKLGMLKSYVDPLVVAPFTVDSLVAANIAYSCQVSNAAKDGL